MIRENERLKEDLKKSETKILELENKIEKFYEENKQEREKLQNQINHEHIEAKQEQDKLYAQILKERTEAKNEQDKLYAQIKQEHIEAKQEHIEAQKNYFLKFIILILLVLFICCNIGLNEWFKDNLSYEYVEEIAENTWLKFLEKIAPSINSIFSYFLNYNNHNFPQLN